MEIAHRMRTPETIVSRRDDIARRLKDADSEIVDVSMAGFQHRKSSSILFLNLHKRDGNTQQVVAKTFYGTDDSASRTRELIERDRAISEHLGQQRSADFPRLATPPVLCAPDVGLIAYPHFQGESLQASARHFASLLPSTGDERVLHHFFLCGRWLRQFQDGSETFVRERFQASRENDVLDSETIASLIRQRAEHIATGGATALSRDEAARLADAADRLAHRCSDDAQELSGIHGDFLPANVIANKGQIHVIDFLMFRAGIRFYDLSYFCFQLETLLLKPYFRPRAIQALLNQFCEGYGLSTTGDFWGSHPSLELLRMLHTVTRLNGLHAGTSGLNLRSLYRRTIASRTKTALLQHIKLVPN